MSSHRFAGPVLASVLLVAAAFPVHAQDTAQAPRYDRYASLMKRVDTDHDGFISQAESDAFAGDRFDRLDADHKGYLTLEDFAAPLHRAIARTTNDRRKAALQLQLARFETAFKTMNKAGDGRLTKAEFLADSHARFAAADVDHDGKLSLDELRHAHGHAF